uniref:Uncharacterized protein n=1 Tax=Candidatus Kentrum sp. TUN TaxID=2126343 RepID=A0A450ZPF0_9GAMM|nr:MAG: hypothetical protein BECKTUN1418F_GA0071002_10314 [Candidatus Kentron sp. TUN]VFK55703.1 MAG: hypothetical protein BECKTUN1418E_GA0071001_10324 [Candidatus Kentron sp. TUN]VFK64303.1 MAG: hypothetical protein BECKTUN1418D_GA0071000_12555 [Candidatus Kentron sp. TUN]
MFKTSGSPLRFANVGPLDGFSVEPAKEGQQVKLWTRQSVELFAAVHMGTKKKHKIRLIWQDDAQEHNEKPAHPTL